MSKLQKLTTQMICLADKERITRQKWEKEKLKSVKPELKALIGKCFYTKYEDGNKTTENYYKVLSAQPNYSVEDNHVLICLEITKFSGYYDSPVYTIDTHSRTYQGILEREKNNEITKEIFEQWFSDILLELEELNV